MSQALGELQKQKCITGQYFMVWIIMRVSEAAITTCIEGIGG